MRLSVTLRSIPVPLLFIALFSLACAAQPFTPPRPAPEIAMNETWTVTIGGQSAPVNADGTFLVPNVVAADVNPVNFEGDDPMRLFATGQIGGETWYAFSDWFRVRSGVTTRVPNLTFTRTPPPAVRTLALSTNRAVFTSLSQSGQLTPTATLNDGRSVTVPSVADWTVYRTSNPAVARVDQDGRITPIGVGRALLTASNDGVTAVVSVFVDLGRTTIVEGLVRDENGVSVGGAVVRISGLTQSVLSDAQGRFQFPDVPAERGAITVLARGLVNGVPLAGVAAGLTPRGGMITDAGILILRSRCSLDPNFGTPLAMGDDSIIRLPLSAMGGFDFAGTNYDAVWVSSNGALRFGALPPATPSPLVTASFAGPGIFPLWMNLNPRPGATLHARQDSDRLTLTWSGVPEWFATGSNTFQVVLQAGGAWQIVYAGVSAASLGRPGPIVGWSGSANPSVRTAADFSGAMTWSGDSDTAILEQLLAGAFDLDFGCLLATPNLVNGYDLCFESLSAP